MFRKLLIWSAAGTAIFNNSLVNSAQTETDSTNDDIDCCIPYPTYAIINEKMGNRISLTVEPMDDSDCDTFNYVSRDTSETKKGSSPFTMVVDDIGVNQSPNSDCAKEFSEDEFIKIAANKKDCRLTKNSIDRGKGITKINQEELWKDPKSRLALSIEISDPRPKPLCDQSSFLGCAKSTFNFFYNFLTPREDEPSQQNNQQAGMTLGG